MKTKPKEVQQEKLSSICAIAYVSESEVQMLFKNYDSSWETSNLEMLHQALWTLGLNVNQEYTRQDNIQHRNKMNKPVFCSRWVGNERFDDEWIKSGYASQEAIDRNKNSGLLDSLYREKLMTKDAQDYLEAKDRSNKDSE